jgi:hypothetical protein
MIGGIITTTVTFEPRAHLGERDEELDARAERVVMPFGLERLGGQVGRDDVQVEVSIFRFVKSLIYISKYRLKCAMTREEEY